MPEAHWHRGPSVRGHFPLWQARTHSKVLWSHRRHGAKWVVSLVCRTATNLPPEMGPCLVGGGAQHKWEAGLSQWPLPIRAGPQQGRICGVQNLQHCAGNLPASVQMPDPAAPARWIQVRLSPSAKISLPRPVQLGLTDLAPPGALRMYRLGACLCTCIASMGFAAVLRLRASRRRAVAPAPRRAEWES